MFSAVGDRHCFFFLSRGEVAEGALFGLPV